MSQTLGLIAIGFGLFQFSSAVFINPIIPWDNITVSLDGFLSSEWAGLTPESALEYYTMREICEFANGLDNKVCANFPGNELGSLKVGGRGFGHVNGYCTNPLGAYVKHKSIKSWPESENLLDIIRRMKADGSNTLVLIGDSLTGQHAGDARISLTRFGVQLQALDIRFRSMMQFDGYQDSFSVIDPDNVKIAQSVAGTTDVPYFNVIFLRVNSFPNHHEYHKYFKNTTSAVTHFPLVAGTVTFVFNVGIHVHNSKSYEEFINGTMPVFMHLAKEGHTVVFRETAAQHFATPTGEYHHVTILPNVPDDQRNVKSPVSMYYNRIIPRVVNSNETSDRELVDFHQLNQTKYTVHRCEAIKSEQALDKQNWRNKQVHAYLAVHDPKMKHIGIAPHFRVTAARHDAHLYSYTEKGDDCTHFCFFPTIWAPTWDYIAKFYASRHKDRNYGKYAHNATIDLTHATTTRLDRYRRNLMELEK